jgi:hypothetical protein
VLTCAVSLRTVCEEDLILEYYPSYVRSQDHISPLYLATSLHLGTAVSSGSGPRYSVLKLPWSDAGR